MLAGFLVTACGSAGTDEQSDPAAVAGSSVAVVEQDSAGQVMSVAEQTRAAPPAGGRDTGPRTELPPNELGRIPIVEYHLIGEPEGRWTRTPENFRKDLELLYSRGYRPITLREMVEARIDLPAGLSPVVFTFDDASPGQFRYVEGPDGELRIDPTSAVGIWLDFAREHPGWENKAVFCMLSGAEAGRSFFGNRGIEGQKTEWRHRKVAFLAEQGFELCNHTLWHANLGRYDDAVVQEQIARLQLAVDSAVPGYRIRSFALPLGEWPKNRELARAGSWTDPKTGRTTTYEHDAILLVAGGPARSPHDPSFDGLRLERVQVWINSGTDELVRTLDQLDRTRTRYISDGDPNTVARPQQDD
jgi:peptidoglycan/xylan/chitin deacetylase (PgdA/CDA1 family)